MKTLISGSAGKLFFEGTLPKAKMDMFFLPGRTPAEILTVFSMSREGPPAPGGFPGSKLRARAGFRVRDKARAQKQVKAPSITKSEPVVKGLASPARYTAMAWSSSGFPSRCMGAMAFHFSIRGISEGEFRVRSVPM